MEIAQKHTYPFLYGRNYKEDNNAEISVQV
jgi:hypothetical protein